VRRVSSSHLRGSSVSNFRIASVIRAADNIRPAIYGSIGLCEFARTSVYERDDPFIVSSVSRLTRGESLESLRETRLFPCRD